MEMGRVAVPVLALTMLSAGAGGWLGIQYGLSHARRPENLNHLLHHEIRLNAEQRNQIASMESVYAAQRRALEQQARAANGELAEVILSERQYGPKAEQAIDQFSAAMKILRIDTVKHVMAMRAVLTPQQAKKFDDTVSAALDSDQP